MKAAPIAVDALLVAVAYSLAFVLRFDSVRNIPEQHLSQFWLFLAIVPFIRLACNAAWGLYRHVWRYVGTRDALAVAGATFTGSAIFALLVVMTGQQGFPRSVVGIEFLLSLVMLLGARLGWRSWAERGPRSAAGATRTLVVGAGDAGELLVRDLVRRPERNMLPIGFIDDDPRKQGARIHGVEVVGTRADLPRIVQERKVDLVVLALPGASLKDRRTLAKLAAATPAQVKTVPSMHDIIDGKVSVSEMRDVAIEDLLGREQVVTDTALLGYLCGRRVLVSGAGGSIGAELCRQIANLQPAQLLLLGHGENSIYLIAQELTEKFGALDVRSLIADTRDDKRIGRIFEEFRPEVVFHAAAHKHVPLMEDNAAEAVTNNVLGTRVMAEAAAAAGCERFVMVSTDKAVNPTSIMGRSKRLAELLIQDLASRSESLFVAVRFGNVLGSRGSVVPLFRQQIAAGGPVTVTHPDMRRYFMTIPEAVTLLLQAAAVGRQGEVLMLEMGEPVRIVDLARNLIKLSGFRPEDVEIVYTGARPGEKLFEELLVTDEAARPTDHPQVFAARRAGPPDPRWWPPLLARLLAAAATQDDAAVRDLLEQAIAADQPGSGAPRAPMSTPGGDAR
ncbi:MAG: polysaccharide biosynthesis protein [Candidatus Sericytochromatia bacterium]|nr:polysaccharide biosynthesis protein [Candidatus Tanganyikabacteria bacterium]